MLGKRTWRNILHETTWSNRGCMPTLAIWGGEVQGRHLGVQLVRVQIRQVDSLRLWIVPDALGLLHEAKHAAEHWALRFSLCGSHCCCCKTNMPPLQKIIPPISNYCQSKPHYAMPPTSTYTHAQTKHTDNCNSYKEYVLQDCYNNLKNWYFNFSSFTVGKNEKLSSSIFWFFFICFYISRNNLNLILFKKLYDGVPLLVLFTTTTSLIILILITDLTSYTIIFWNIYILNYIKSKIFI